MKPPCNFDHNGECLICGCWPEHCAYKRYLNEDYSFESKGELETMFGNLTVETKVNSERLTKDDKYQALQQKAIDLQKELQQVYELMKKLENEI